MEILTANTYDNYYCITRQTFYLTNSQLTKLGKQNFSLQNQNSRQITDTHTKHRIPYGNDQRQNLIVNNSQQ